MSNHIHEVLTDTRGELPNFIRERNRALANALKCHRRWPEEVFQRAPANCVELHGAAAVLRQIGYTLANCVEAGLVNSPTEWPGPTVLPEEIGTRTIIATRPSVYFDPENEVWPEQAELHIAMPEDLVTEHGSRAAAEIRTAVQAAVVLARNALRAAGKAIKSAYEAVALPFEKRAKSFETFGKRYPTFAAGGVAHLAKRALAMRREFRTAYAHALRAWRAGHRDVPFPRGTWRWHRELGAPAPQIFQCRSDLQATCKEGWWRRPRGD